MPATGNLGIASVETLRERTDRHEFARLFHGWALRNFADSPERDELLEAAREMESHDSSQGRSALRRHAWLIGLVRHIKTVSPDDRDRAIDEYVRAEFGIPAKEIT